MSAADLLFDPTVYPNPDTYRPERWLTPDPEEQRKMNKAFVPFSAGPRKCTGLKYVKF